MMGISSASSPRGFTALRSPRGGRRKSVKRVCVIFCELAAVAAGTVAAGTAQRLSSDSLSEKSGSSRQERAATFGFAGASEDTAEAKAALSSVARAACDAAEGPLTMARTATSLSKFTLFRRVCSGTLGSHLKKHLYLIIRPPTNGAHPFSYISLYE